MRIDIRCTNVKIVPSDASGFRVEAEVADRAEIEAQVLAEKEAVISEEFARTTKAIAIMYDMRDELRAKITNADAEITRLKEELKNARDDVSAGTHAMALATIADQDSRFRTVVQILNEAVPLDGPKNAEEVARIAVDEIGRLNETATATTMVLAEIARDLGVDIAETQDETARILQDAFGEMKYTATRRNAEIDSWRSRFRALVDADAPDSAGNKVITLQADLARVRGQRDKALIALDRRRAMQRDRAYADDQMRRDGFRIVILDGLFTVEEIES